MAEMKGPFDRQLASLIERAKELHCLYKVGDVLADHQSSLAEVCPRIVEAIPLGWKFPEVCRAKVRIESHVYSSVAAEEPPWMQQAPVVIENKTVGDISVYYLQKMPEEDDGPFLNEEARLLQTIADRLASFVAYKRIRVALGGVDYRGVQSGANKRRTWQAILETISEADNSLFLSISRQMLWHLSVSGVDEAMELCKSYGMDIPRSQLVDDAGVEMDQNGEQWVDITHKRGLRVFDIASEHLDDQQILQLINGWIQDDQLSALAQVANRNLPLVEVVDAIRTYYQPHVKEIEIPTASMKGIRVALIRRLLSDRLDYIHVAKKCITVQDMHDLLKTVVFSADSQGKLGGKAAALFLASQILKKYGPSGAPQSIRVPKTWYITSDILASFLRHHSLGHVVAQKYKNIDLVRLEYPHIVDAFKSGRLPYGISKALSFALDDFGDRPLIVRSSSLLEERIGVDFSGKYKSVCLPNQGPKHERMIALTDAITDVYASTFGPDPIEYRAKHGLLDFGEEMGIMIQEVVGRRVGRYFLPTFSATVQSMNEMTWLPHARKKDGLLKLVPGLSPRIVSNSVDKSPVLLATVESGLRLADGAEGIAENSPRQVNVINMDSGKLENIQLSSLMKEVGPEIPGIENVVSVMGHGRLDPVRVSDVNCDDDCLVAAFDGLIKHTPVISQIRAVMRTLAETIGEPVRIGLAWDGEDLYLLHFGQQPRL